MHIWLVQFPEKTNFLNQMYLLYTRSKCIPCYFMTVSIIATAGLRNQPINGVLSHNQIARNAYLVGSIPRKNKFLKPDVAIIHPVKVHPMLLYDRVYNSYSWFKKSAHKRCIVTQPNRTECIFGWFNTPKKQISSTRCSYYTPGQSASHATL